MNATISLELAEGLPGFIVEDLCSERWLQEFGDMPSVDLLRECAYVVKRNWVRRLHEIARFNPYILKGQALGELQIEVARFVKPRADAGGYAE